MARVIVQARTDSARLPGKALLPVGGLPSAVLAALRAANSGLDVVLATTERPVDDALAQAARSAGLDVFRGNAENVRQRFLAACADLADDELIVRLTADNLLPDGALIETVLTYCQSNNLDYINLDMLWQDVPYGLSVEVFRLGALRRLAEKLDDKWEREHVTPALRRLNAATNAAQAVFQPDRPAIRCTMDTFADYQRISRCFSGLSDPQQIGWQALLDRLVAMPDAPLNFSPGPPMLLGTAQLAACYGSASQVEPPAPAEGIEIVRCAVANRIEGIDTARAYPGSEQLIGSALQGGYGGQIGLISKLSPLDDLPAQACAELVEARVENSVLQSLLALGTNPPPDLLLHRAVELEQWDGAAWGCLQRLQAEGHLGRLGVSVQTVAEARLALATEGVQIIQLPCNLLDWRWREHDLNSSLRERSDICVHIRSVFLQGVLLRPATDWPVIDDVDPVALLNQLDGLVKALGRVNVADLCIAWARAQPWVDGVIVGIEGIAQLHDSMRHFCRSPLTPDQCRLLEEQLPVVPETLLNPAMWPPRESKCRTSA